MTIFLNPFFRCECGKLHVRSGLGPLGKSVCKCGRDLVWHQATAKRKNLAE